MPERVVLAMSGGVDSSVAAALLLEQGYEVVGLFMRHGQAQEETCRVDAAEASEALLPVIQPDRHAKGCCTAQDARDAQRVADRLGIPFYAINFEREFGRIMDYFAAEYSRGRTPNPCVMCNNWIKFGRLWEFAQDIGAQRIATGHYVRLVPVDDPDGVPALCKGRDPGKDQSYVLFGIRRELLPHLLFPVGEFHKSEIRRRAAELGLQVAHKPDSQEICFVPDGDHAAMVRRHRGGTDLSGEIVTLDGRVVGRHRGIEHFTIGQRKGLGVALGTPQFVVRIEPETRRVVIGPREALACRRFTASQANWLVPEPRKPFECEVKIRYLSNPEPAVVTPLPGDRFRVELAGVKHAVTPGQAVVCYQGDRVLGGGWID